MVGEYGLSDLAISMPTVVGRVTALSAASPCR